MEAANVAIQLTEDGAAGIYAVANGAPTNLKGSHLTISGGGRPATQGVDVEARNTQDAKVQLDDSIIDGVVVATQLLHEGQGGIARIALTRVNATGANCGGGELTQTAVTNLPAQLGDPAGGAHPRGRRSGRRGRGAADARDPIATFAWSFGDGTTGGGAQVEHVWAEPGTYEVALTVTDSTGKTHTATASVVVAAKPAVVVGGEPPANETVGGTSVDLGEQGPAVTTPTQPRDIQAPAVSGLRRRGASLHFTLDEAATLRIRVERRTRSRGFRRVGAPKPLRGRGARRAPSGTIRTRGPGRARTRGDPLPPVPAPRRVARGGGARQAGVVRARGVLGAAGPGVRRPGRAGGRVRPRAGRARRQPDGPGVHRRPLRRLPLRLAAPVGYANQPISVSRDDGLRLSDCWVTAAVRCAPPANKPTPAERDRCIGTWMVPELSLLPRARVLVCLGAFAWDAALRVRAALPGGDPVPRPRPRFAHGAELPGAPWTLLGCFHPSQQNTFTGVLTPPMMDAVFERARVLSD
jgi:uracil-DNA glycosylase